MALEFAQMGQIRNHLQWSRCGSTGQMGMRAYAGLFKTPLV